MRVLVGTVLRRVRLAGLAEGARYRWLLLVTARRRAAFMRAHPSVRLPHPRTLYETFGLDYHAYYHGGRDVAAWVAGLIGKYAPASGGTVCDWGCGPARVVRHLPALLDADWRVRATDHDEATIRWCRSNIPHVEFAVNDSRPPLDAGNGSLDVLYSISVLTHVSEAGHAAWMAELARVLRPDGLVILTTHGVASAARLGSRDREAFARGRLVCLGGVREGSRLFGSYQPEPFMRALFEHNGFEVLEHRVGQPRDGRVEQDVWIARREASSVS